MGAKTGGGHGATRTGGGQGSATVHTRRVPMAMQEVAETSRNVQKNNVKVDRSMVESTRAATAPAASYPLKTQQADRSRSAHYL